MSPSGPSSASTTGSNTATPIGLTTPGIAPSGFDGTVMIVPGARARETTVSVAAEATKTVRPRWSRPVTRPEGNSRNASPSATSRTFHAHENVHNPQSTPGQPRPSAAVAHAAPVAAIDTPSAAARNSQPIETSG